MAHARVPLRLRANAKRLRADATHAERRLWSVLRADQLRGLKFKRQVPLEGYIVDFVCFEARLVIEADGSQHMDSQTDLVRDSRLAAAGYRTLRFWNSDILGNLEGVVRLIEAALDEP